MLKPLQVKKLRKEHSKAKEKAREALQVRMEAERASRVLAFLESDLPQKMPYSLTDSIVESLRSGNMAVIPAHLYDVFAKTVYPTTNSKA